MKARGFIDSEGKETNDVVTLGFQWTYSTQAAF